MTGREEECLDIQQGGPSILDRKWEEMFKVSFFINGEGFQGDGEIPPNSGTARKRPWRRGSRDET